MENRVPKFINPFNERDACEESLKYYNDLKNSLDTAFNDGKKEGMEEAAAEFSLLIEEERRQKEEAQNKVSELVKFLLSLHIPIPEIAEKTKMPEVDIRKLME